MTTEKLTSIRLQPMMNINKPELDLWCPTLNFGRKKSGRFKFPIVFSNYKQAEKLYDELAKLKGKTLDELKAEANKLDEEFKKYNKKNMMAKLLRILAELLSNVGMMVAAFF